MSARSSRQSAGIVLHRGLGDALEVLLVHPGGPAWSKRDAGAWSIPSGEYTDGEDPLAALLARGNDKPDRAAAEVALLELVADGDAVRHPLGDDAVWQSATAPEPMVVGSDHALAVS